MNSIPAETLTQILDYLLEDEGPDLPLGCTSPIDKDPLLDQIRCIRLVCKSFRDAVAPNFWKFFEKRSIILEHNSLKRLKKIVQRKHIREHLLELDIHTFQLKESLTQWSKFRQAFREERETEDPCYLNYEDGENGLPFQGSKALKAFHAYKHLYNHQEQMKSSGARKAILAEIFELLNGHLKSITISGHECGPALRPIVQKVGLSHFHTVNKSDEEDHEYDETKAVSEIFHAIYWSRLSLCTLNFSASDHFVIDLPPHIIRYLKKGGAYGENHIHNLQLVLKPTAVFGEDCTAHRWVQACPNLAHLTITFPLFSDDPVDIRYLFGTSCLQHLKHFHLQGFSLGAQEFAKLLYRHRETLTCVMASNIILKSGNWASIFKFIHDHLKLDEIDIHQVFEPELVHLHCISKDIEDYVLRRKDTMDWLALAKRLKASDNGMDNLMTLGAMAGGMAQKHVMLLDDDFWGNPAILTEAGPIDLKARAYETDDEDWEVENGVYDSDLGSEDDYESFWMDDHSDDENKEVEDDESDENNPGSDEVDGDEDMGLDDNAWGSASASGSSGSMPALVP